MKCSDTRIARRLYSIGVLSIAALAGVLAHAPAASALTCTPLSDFPAPPPNAPLPGSCFDGWDGDQVDSDGATPAPPAAPNRVDWGSAEVLGAAQVAPDYESGGNDSQFGPGGQEQVPDSWTFDFGSQGSDKYDFISGYSYAEPNTQDLIFAMGFVRRTNNGTSWLAFELNQLQPGYRTATETGSGRQIAVPTRSNGDVLITYSVSNNNNPKPIIGLCKWKGDEHTGVWTDLAGVPVGQNCPALGPALAQADINGADIPANENFLGSPSGMLEKGTFGEAAINITESLKVLGGNPNTDDPCVSFGYFWAHSRSAESITSNQQDYILPQDAIAVANCAVSGKKWHDKDGNGLVDGTDEVMAGWTIYADYDNSGTLGAGEPSTVTGPDGTYVLGDLAKGTYKIREIDQTGWQCTSPNPCAHEVTMTGALIPGKDFLNFEQKPAIELDKTAKLEADGKITYTFKITNTGNVALDGVDLDDALVGFDNAVCNAVTVLAPGASTTCSASYTPTQAEIDAGKVDNAADACGDSPLDVEVCDPDDTSTPLPQNPAIDLAKTAKLEADGKITYTFVITNTGNVTLDGVDLDDALVGKADATCEKTVLAPGEKATCTASYTPTQADIDAGKVDNSADACGDSPKDVEVCDPGTTSTPLPQNPAIELDKTAKLESDGKITYTFKITNTGNVTLDGVDLDDALVGFDNAACGAVSVLAPGASTTCTATYTVTQADIDAGKVDNAADACGDSPKDVEVCDPDGTSTPLARDPKIEVDKEGPATTHHGASVTFMFLVTNTGNVTLTNVTVADDKCAAVTGPVAYITGDDDDRLEVGEQWRFICTKTVEAHAGGEANPVVNTATATGTDPAGGTVTDTDTHSMRVQHPAVNIDKAGPATAEAGSRIGYSLTVTNPGDVPLIGETLSVTDPACDAPPLLAGKYREAGGDPTPDTLDPGDTWQYGCFVQSAKGQTQVVNTAFVTGEDAGKVKVSDDDTVTTQLTQPRIEVLPETIVSGAANLRGPSKCVNRPFIARVTGKRIKSVSWFVDGKRVKRFTSKTGEATRANLRVRPDRYGAGVHRLRARITFAAASRTGARTLRMTFQQCARQVIAPKFTG